MLIESTDNDDDDGDDDDDDNNYDNTCNQLTKLSETANINNNCYLWILLVLFCKVKFPSLSIVE